jgi:hypothetical protein
MTVPPAGTCQAVRYRNAVFTVLLQTSGFTGYEHRGRTISSHARVAAASRRIHAMTLPEGLIYVPGFLTEAEQRDVLAVLATFELQPYVLHDTPSRRLVRSRNGEVGRALWPLRAVGGRCPPAHRFGTNVDWLSARR